MGDIFSLDEPKVSVAKHNADLSELAINPRTFGAAGTARIVSDAAVGSGDLSLLTSATGAFTSANAGQPIVVFKGLGVGAHLQTTIASVVSSTQVILAAPVSAAVTAVPAAFGPDDTAAIDQAFASADAKAADGAVVTFSAGRYMYLGSGWGSATPRVAGANKSAATVILGAGNFLVNSSASLTDLTLTGLSVRFGGGAIRLSNTAAQVNGMYTVHNNDFRWYVGTCISHSSSDMPYWKISGNLFQGANYSSSMGVALSGYADLCDISNNAFTKNRVAVKARLSGNNLKIRANDFIRLTATTDGYPRVDVWIVPNPSSTNSGQGLEVISNKFGNENVAAGDYRIVVADEDTASGSDNGTYFPALITASVGYLRGAKFDNTVIGGANLVPYVYTTTKNIGGCAFAGQITGTSFTYALQYLSAPGVDVNTVENVFGPFRASSLGQGAPLVMSNGVGVGHMLDPNRVMSATPEVAQGQSAGDFGDYTEVVAVPTFSLSGATVSAVTDAMAGADATEITFTASSGQATVALASPLTGVPLWIEFDVQAGASSPLAQVRATLQYSGAGAVHWQRVVVVPSNNRWARYRFPVVLREATSTINLNFGTGITGTGTVRLGRVRAYHAREPVNVDLARRTATFTPAEHGLIAWSLDPSAISNSLTMTAGTLYLAALPPLMTARRLSTLWLTLAAGGTGTFTTGQNLAGLFLNGYLIAQSSDQSTAWASAGNKSMPLVVPLDVARGRIQIGVLYNGTGGVAPALARGSSTAASTIGQTSLNFRTSTAGTGLTALPTTLGAQTALQSMPFLAVS